MESGYCSFELSKLLKERGFDEPCNYIYLYLDEDDIRVTELNYPKKCQSLKEHSYPYTTYQVAMEFLRKSYNVNFEIRCKPNKVEVFVMTIEELPKCLCRGISSDTYNDAIEKGLKYYLNSLIGTERD